MSVASYFKRVFSLEPRHPFIASDKIFLELDLEHLKKDLRLEKEAKNRGERNNPPSETAIFDDVENKVITAIEFAKRGAYQELIDYQKTYNDRIRACNFQTRLLDLATSADNAISDFKVRVHDGKDKLFEFRENVANINQEFYQFKMEHGIDRTPAFPNSRLFHFSIPILFVTIEALLNGSFLAKGHEFGIVGGVFEALVIALINVGTGLMVGWTAVREINHRKVFRKLLGFSISLVYLVLLLAFNLTVAHYRDALGGHLPEKASEIALQSFFTKPWGVVDLKSWMLSIMGCIFSLISVGDGYKMDDPYPGFGKIARRRSEILNEYTAAKEDLMGELQGIRDEASRKINIIAHDLNNRRAEYQNILAAKERIKTHFEQYLNYLEQCGNNLLNYYRETNRSSRTTPVPGHFSQKWQIDRPVNAPAADSHSETENEINEVFSTLLPKKLKQIQTDYEAAILEYQQIQQLIKEAVNNGQPKLAEN